MSDCAICFEAFGAEPITTLSCKHQYHHTCIGSWLSKEGQLTCPLCRGKVTLKARTKKRAPKPEPASETAVNLVSVCLYQFPRGVLKGLPCGAKTTNGRYCAKHTALRSYLGACLYQYTPSLKCGAPTVNGKIHCLTHDTQSSYRGPTGYDGKGRISGLMLFMRQVCDAAGTPAQQRGAAWKALSEAERSAWAAKAAERNVANGLNA